MTDADEIRRQGQQLAAMDARLVNLEVEIGKWRDWRHDVYAREVAPAVLGFGPMRERVKAMEDRITLVERAVASVQTTADDSKGKIAATWATVGNFVSRIVVPLLLAYVLWVLRLK